MLSSLVNGLDSLCMLEAAAIFAGDPTILLRAADLTLLGYVTHEADAALFALANLGLVEPLECRDDAEFAVVADARKLALLFCFGTALREPLFRLTVTLEVLDRERG